MAIFLAEWEDIDAVRDFLDDNDIAIQYTSTHSLPAGTTSHRHNGQLMDPPYTWSDGSTMFLIDLPVHLIRDLSKLVRPERMSYTGELPYPHLTPELNELVIAHQAGLLPSAEWPTAVVSTSLLDVQTFNELTRYLNGKKDDGAVIVPEPEFYAYMTFGAVVPLDLIAPMSELPGVAQIELFLYPTPPGYLDYVFGLIDDAHAASDGSVAGAQAAPTPTPTPTPMLTPTLTPTPSPSLAQEYACRLSQPTPPQPTPPPGLQTTPPGLQPTPPPGSQPTPPPGSQPTPGPPVPQKEPSRLAAVFAAGAVVLCWTPGSDPNYVRQVIKRREQAVHPPAWTHFALNPSADAYADTTTLPGKTYIYLVEGLREDGRFGASAPVAITTP